MSLAKRAREIWLDGDDFPFETLSRQLDEERATQERASQNAATPHASES